MTKLKVYANYKLSTGEELATIWKALGSIATVGSTHYLTIPTDAKEIFIEVFPLSRYDGISLTLLKSLLSVDFKGYDAGFYKNAGDMMRVLVYATSTRIWVQEIVMNSTMYTSIFACNVYYR